MKNEQLLGIMHLKPESLVREQHKALKRHAISVIKKVSDMIENEDYNSLLDEKNDILRKGHKDDIIKKGRFINFDYGGHWIEDIGEVVEELQRLKQMADSERPTASDSTCGLVHVKPDTDTDRWIPVTEELPDKDVAVQITYVSNIDGKYYCGAFAYMHDDEWYNTDECEINNTITAWRYCEPYLPCN